jgi:hypothetical protein
MRKTYSISIEPTTVTRQGLKNIEQFLTELSTIDGVEVSNEKLEFICDSEMEDNIIQLSEKYSIVNLIGL